MQRSTLANQSDITVSANKKLIQRKVCEATREDIPSLIELNKAVPYARAAVFSPSDYPFARDGIAAESNPDTATSLVCDGDLDRQRAARSSGTVTPRLDRRPDLFKFVTALPGSQSKTAPDTKGLLGANPISRQRSSPQANE